MDLWRIQPDGSELEQLTTHAHQPAHPTPIDSNTLLYVALDELGGGPWLWALDIKTRTSRRLSYGIERFTSIAAAGDGHRIAASVADPEARLCRIPIRDDMVSEADVRPVDLPMLRARAPRFGPEDLFYLSSRGSGDGLWRYHDGIPREVWKGTNHPLLEPVAVSADGSSIALVLRRDGKDVLHVLSPDGAELRALSSDLDVRGAVSWSPDGDWIVAGGVDAQGRQGLFKLGVNQERVEMIVEGAATHPVWSPNGDLIVYAGPQVRATAPILAVRPDGTPVDLPAIEVSFRGQYMRFLPDGHALVHMRAVGNLAGDFWILDLQTMHEQQLSRLEDKGVIETFDITPDGNSIVFDRLQENSDIVLIELAGS
jgi:dipeptidyl aminopeptidase/acylaminoacyl peptidase